MIADYIKIDDEQLSVLFANSQKVEDFLGNSLRLRIEKILDSLGCGENESIILGSVDKSAHIKGRVYIAEGAVVEPTAFIEGPTYIGECSTVRHGAYVRGNVYAARNCVIGHATEVKGAIFCNEAKAGHFAYIGDSVLGNNVNLGAGTKLANLRFDGSEVKLRLPSGEKINTSLKKLGAILGDNSQTGCNSVLSPGRVLARDQFIPPCKFF